MSASNTIESQIFIGHESTSVATFIRCWLSQLHGSYASSSFHAGFYVLRLLDPQFITTFAFFLLLS